MPGVKYCVKCILAPTIIERLARLVTPRVIKSSKYIHRNKAISMAYNNRGWYRASLVDKYVRSLWHEQYSAACIDVCKLKAI